MAPEIATNENGPQAGKGPTHAAYSVRERENQRIEWRPVGVAWQHADGKGLNIVLDLVPLDDRITLGLIEDRNR
jgi:hypothetical protein